MLEVGWSEILVIAVVLIVVVGPKDLPPMLRAFGKMTTRLRAMAGQFQTQFSEALKEADLDDVRKTMQDAQKLNPLNTLREAITPIQQMGNELKSELQKSVATPAFNPTVFPAASETTDPVAEILDDPTALLDTAPVAPAAVAPAAACGQACGSRNTGSSHSFGACRVNFGTDTRNCFDGSSVFQCDCRACRCRQNAKKGVKVESPKVGSCG